MTAFKRKRTGVLDLLRDRSGASFIFVLGIMLALMVISVSALVAAGANISAAANQNTHSQLILITDSIQKSIVYGLQRDEGDDTMSSKLVKMILDANDHEVPDSYSASGLGNMEIMMGFGGFSLTEYGYESELMLTFPAQAVDIIPAVPSVPALYEYDEDGTAVEIFPAIPREAKTASVSAEMLVTATIRRNGQIVMITRTLYRYEGGSLSDDPDGTLYTWDTSSTPHDMQFVEYGYWRLVKHERVEV